MANGTRGGSNDGALPLIATDDITAGAYNGMSAQVVKLGVGADNVLDLVDSAHPIPVASPRGFAAALIQKVTTLTTLGTAYPIPASALSNRATMLIQALDTNTDPVWIGSATVTATGATAGIKLAPGASISMDLQAAVALYAVSTANSQKVATLELS